MVLRVQQTPMEPWAGVDDERGVTAILSPEEVTAQDKRQMTNACIRPAIGGSRLFMDAEGGYHVALKNLINLYGPKRGRLSNGGVIPQGISVCIPRRPETTTHHARVTTVWV